MRQHRETVEHPFGALKARMGAIHFLTKTLPKVAAQMALLTFRCSVLRVLRPLARAWAKVPPEWQFSFGEWVSGAKPTYPRYLEQAVQADHL
jgi:hypothetical protein